MLLTSVEAEPAEAGDPAPPPRPVTSARRALVVAVALVYSALWAVLCDLVLELSVWVGMAGPPWYAVLYQKPGIIPGALVLWVLLLTLVCVTNRLWLSMGLLLALVLTVAAVSRAKLAVRQEPLYPSDLDFLTSPRFLLAMTTPLHLVLGLVALVGVVAGAVLVGRRLDGRFPRVRRAEAPGGRWWWGLLAARVAVGGLCVALLLSATHFNRPGNLWRTAYEANDADWRFWYQRLNYHDNGFVGGFLYNMPTPAMTTPAGYDEVTMQALAAKYAARAAARNAGLRPTALDDVNVVLVLSEAFSDPIRLDGFVLDHDPLPRTRATMAATTSGTMLAQLYGGGTANMEFELLTGQSLALFEPQLNTPYQMLVPDYPTYPSAVAWFEAHGHRTVAVHPYFTGMYKRDQVYRTFGFDDFVHDTTMQRTETIGEDGFISDASAFTEVEHQISTSEEPLLVNLVTMQNHVPVTGKYDDPLRATGAGAEQNHRIGQYARGLEHTDEALATFLQDLQDSDEKTVVVFYGDHQPGIYDDDVLEQNPGEAMYRTPYFLWSSEGNTPRSMPLTSPTHFLPMVFDLVGQPLPPYYELLEELRAEVPAMEQGRFVTPTGEELTEGELGPRARELLADLRLVQYDFSVGERYAVDRMWLGGDSG